MLPMTGIKSFGLYKFVIILRIRDVFANSAQIHSSLHAHLKREARIRVHTIFGPQATVSADLDTSVSLPAFPCQRSVGITSSGTVVVAVARPTVHGLLESRSAWPAREDIAVTPRRPLAHPSSYGSPMPRSGSLSQRPNTGYCKFRMDKRPILTASASSNPDSSGGSGSESSIESGVSSRTQSCAASLLLAVWGLVNNAHTRRLVAALLRQLNEFVRSIIEFVGDLYESVQSTWVLFM